jgi:hypothetical protein
VRIPFPERVPLNRVALFAATLFIIQIAEGTKLYFSAGCVAFIMIAAIAFNVAGGLTRASGAYVFFYSVLVFIVGVSYKAFLGEPAESNLIDPGTDIAVYVGGITAMLAAVVASRRFSRKTGLLEDILDESKMYRSSIGCLAIGVMGGFAIALLGDSAVLLGSAFAQINQFIPLGLIIGVMYEIRRSGGKRSVNLPLILGGSYLFFLGAVGFSKEGMLTPLLCWLLPVCALRFRLSARQVLFSLLAVFYIFQYLVPYSQYGRNAVPEKATYGQRIAIAASPLEHPVDTRQTYLQGVDEAVQQASSHTGQYYNTPQGFWSRLQFVSTDDPLIDLTDQGKTVGLIPIVEAFSNTIPRFFWPHKPAARFGGNYYAHELGQLAEEDTTTGIAFSPTAEAYHMAQWVGVLVVAPLLWFLLFVIYDSLFGDIRATPWGLLAMSEIAHFAPEAGLSGMIHFLTFGVEILVFCALFAVWVAPVFATFLLGPDRPNVAPRFSLRTDLAQETVLDDHA